MQDLRSCISRFAPLRAGLACVLAALAAPAIAAQDFIIAFSGGDITGTQVGALLIGGNVSILSSAGATAGNGDIFANDAVIWGTNTLTLTAARDININASLISGGALTLNSATANGADAALPGGSIVQSSGAITASSLTGGSGGETVLASTVNAIGQIGSFTSAGNFNLTNSMPITQSAALTIGGTSTFDAGSNAITLTNAGNSFAGAVSASGSNVAITNIGALTLGTITAFGTLNLTAGGNISQVGMLFVQSTSNFNAGSNAITLLNAGNSFAGAVSASGSDVGITNNNALTLGTVSATGALNVAAGGITQSGALVVTGPAVLDAGSNAIILTNVGNSFTGGVSASGAGVSIASSGALVLGTVTSSGVLALSAASVANAGTLTFGNGGTLGNIAGDYSQNSAASLNIQATPGSCDNLAITGTTGLGGTLNVAFSTPPAIGFSCTLITSGSSLSGTFSTANVTGLGANEVANLAYGAGVVLNIVGTTPVRLQSFDVD